MSDSLFEMQFPAVAGRPVMACFDGGALTSDAGLIPLSQADRRLRLTERLADQIVDTREPAKVRHQIVDLLRERIFAIAAGYEDANDLDSLCRDPALLLSCGKPLGMSLASQPTLSRFENEVETKDLYCLAETLACVVIEQLPSDTRSVILDADPTDDACHGQQEFEFFHGHYDKHCYLPLYLYVTADDGAQRLIAAVLRPGNAGAKDGLFGLLRRVIGLLRKRFPCVAITFRADSAFGDGEVLSFCEKHGLAYSLGLKKNPRLERETQWMAERVLADNQALGTDQQEYISFTYQAEPWERAHRVVAKVETVRGKLNIRYILTSRPCQQPQRAYAFYCERGDRENRIKEMKIDLNAGRTSCHRFWANQFRLILHAAACVLWRTVQDALVGTCWANKQIATLRLMLIKIGARVIQSCRRIVLHLPTSCPYQGLWQYLYQRLLPQPT
jgi:hypothetical protein